MAIIFWRKKTIFRKHRAEKGNLWRQKNGSYKEKCKFVWKNNQISCLSETFLVHKCRCISCHLSRNNDWKVCICRLNPFLNIKKFYYDRKLLLQGLATAWKFHLDQLLTIITFVIGGWPSSFDSLLQTSASLVFLTRDHAPSTLSLSTESSLSISFSWIGLDGT